MIRIIPILKPACRFPHTKNKTGISKVGILSEKIDFSVNKYVNIEKNNNVNSCGLGDQTTAVVITHKRIVNPFMIGFDLSLMKTKKILRVAMIATPIIMPIFPSEL